MDNFFLSILLGLLAMFSWGVGDLLAAIASRKIGALKSYFWMRVAGVILASFYLLKTKEKVSLGLYFILPLIFAGILDFVGTLSFYKGFSTGQVSIVSPIASSWSLVTVILSIIFLKETLYPIQILAIFLIIVGIWLTSIDSKEFLDKKKLNFNKGGKEGLIAMSTWGLMAFLFILASKLVNSWYLPIMIYRVFGILTTLLYVFLFKKDLVIKKDKLLSLKLIIPIGLLDQIANFSFNFGSLIGQASIISPIASAFCVVTVILGIIFFKEKLFLAQIFGIVSVIAGIVILST